MFARSFVSRAKDDLGGRVHNKTLAALDAGVALLEISELLAENEEAPGGPKSAGRLVN